MFVCLFALTANLQVVINVSNLARTPQWPQWPQTAHGSEEMCTIPIVPEQIPEEEQPAGAESFSGEVQRNQQDLLTEIDIWNVILSFKNSFDLFLKYFGDKLNVLLQHIRFGSLLITVKCGSLHILEGLWEDYKSGHLNEVAQEMLVTTEVLEKVGLTEVKLKTFISEEEYEKGKQIFAENSGNHSGV